MDRQLLIHGHLSVDTTCAGSAPQPGAQERASSQVVTRATSVGEAGRDQTWPAQVAAQLTSGRGRDSGRDPGLADTGEHTCNAMTGTSPLLR